MSANSKNSVFLFLVTLHSILSAGYCTASTTLLITGHSSENNYKYAFAQKFVSQVELDRAHSADFLAISSGSLDAASEEEGVVLRTIGGVALSGNLSQVVISRLGSNEMSLEHIQLLFKYIDTDEPLIVVEIGEQSVQTKSLLSKGALCWGEARANILSPNKAYICNDVPEQTIRAIVDFQSVRGIVDPEKPLFVEPQPRQFWPTFFASAARTEKRRGRKPEIVEVDEEDVEDIVDQIMQDIKEMEPAKKDEKSVEEEKKVGDKKLYCRYRKSCYESGKRPAAEASETWFDLEKLTSYFSAEDDDDKENKSGEEEDDDKEDIDEEEDLTPLKLKCKYRLDCYKRKGIKLTGKDEEREQRKSLLAGKSLPQQGKKRTLKDIAERTINKVKVAEEKAAARPVPKAVVVERKLNEIEEKLNEKLACKYRKSCYETGEPPVIESAWVMPSFSTYSAEEAAEEVDFQEMEDLEKKLFCKYRKSCYDTGVKPEIETEFQIHSFKDLKDLPDVIETRKMTIQEKCKYRKSCYETGIVPEINPQLETVIEKEVSTVIPSNVDDLRKFCKYRKSCYEEIAQSASVETVKNIRKRRLIEREVRRRKARRARMRRRLRDVELDSISRPVKRRAEQSAGRRHVHKAKRYVVEKEAPPVVEEKKEEAPQKEEVEEQAVKKGGRRKTKETPVVVEEVIEAVKEEAVEDVAPKVVKSFRSKKHREPEPEPEAEPEPEPVPEPEKEKPKQRGRRAKEPKVEEVQEEPEVVEKVPKRGKRHREVLLPEEIKEVEKEPPVEEVKGKKTSRKKAKVEEIKEEPVEEQKEEVKEEKEEEPEEPKVVHKKKGKKSAVVATPVPVHEDTADEPQEERKEEHHHLTDAEYREHLQLQMFCKYRKSCYETKERPVIVQTMATLFATFDSHVNEHYDRLERKGAELSEADRKLSCKYRKSCYESGELPVIRRDEEESEEKEEVVKKEVKREMKKVQAPKKVVKEESEEKEDNDEEVKKVPAHEELPHLDVDQKLECKYRKSCYTSSTPKQKATRAVVTPHGTVEHKKCNEYYLSCREQLGLPPKIKAPMGPNGRRLCRKKKTEDQ